MLLCDWRNRIACLGRLIVTNHAVIGPLWLPYVGQCYYWSRFSQFRYSYFWCGVIPAAKSDVATFQCELFDLHEKLVQTLSNVIVLCITNTKQFFIFNNSWYAPSDVVVQARDELETLVSPSSTLEIVRLLNKSAGVSSETKKNVASDSCTCI